MYKIEDIEDAIVTHLQGTGLADITKTIDSYHGEIDDLVNEAKKLIIPLPAVLVLYAGSQFYEPANRSFDDEMSFTVVVIARDLRGRASLRAGIYEILEILKTELIDNALDLNIEPLHPLQIEASAVTKGLSIYCFDLKTSMSID